MPNRFLNVKEVVAEAMSIIPGGSTSSTELIARQWAYTGLRQLGPSKDFIAVCDIPVSGLTARKPDDMISAIDMSLFDENGCEIPFNYRSGGSRIHNRKGILQPDSISQLDGLNVEVSEDAYYFHLSSTDLAKAATVAHLRYFKFPVDDEGLPMIPEKCKLAVIMFIRYFWTLRTGGTRFEVSSALQTWEIERARAKAKMKAPSQMEYDAIAKSWMSMLPAPNFDGY